MEIFQKSEFILDYLERLYPDPKASLRFDDQPFMLLIATLLSARCRDDRVNEVTAILFKNACTPQVMAQLPIETLRHIIKPCGLSHAKAKHILALSKMLCATHQGQVPASFEALERLPGVGHKTASVVLGHAFHLSTFPVDTHIKRLALRWKLSSNASVKHIENNLKSIFPQKVWFKLHLQMIYYGREHCNRYRCTTHHLCPICKILAENDQG